MMLRVGDNIVNMDKVLRLEKTITRDDWAIRSVSIGSTGFEDTYYLCIGAREEIDKIFDEIKEI